MSALALDYFDDWKDRVLTCPGCGWKGKFDDGEIELYEELMRRPYGVAHHPADFRQKVPHKASWVEVVRHTCAGELRVVCDSV